MQQRYVLAGVLFLSLGIAFTLRMTFPLVLTQMVYVPNADKKNDTYNPNGELICPIKGISEERQDETVNWVSAKINGMFYDLTLSIGQFIF